MHAIKTISQTEEKRRTVRGTHTELTDHHLRLILANELLVLRRVMHRAANKGHPFQSDFSYGTRVGLDTFARRFEGVEKYGMEKGYAQNYPQKEDKSDT